MVYLCGRYHRAAILCARKANTAITHRHVIISVSRKQASMFHYMHSPSLTNTHTRGRAGAHPFSAVYAHREHARTHTHPSNYKWCVFVGRSFFGLWDVRSQKRGKKT